MNREELEEWIREQYGAEPDHPWMDSPEYAVFRHAGNRKWFALIIEVPKDKLGLPGKGLLSVVNLKCGPLLTGSLRGKAGYDELTALIRSLYENLISGLLPERQYKQLMKQYDDEQAELETKIEEMKKALAEEKVNTVDIKHFISLIQAVS